MQVIESLDITPTMFDNATDKYQAIAKFLASKGVDADIYPQGSFALGTVVRPVTRTPDAGYDLDLICQLRKDREEQSPGELRSEVERILKDSELYGGKLELFDQCITIHYADVGKVSFSIDVVPAANESDINKQRLVEKSQVPMLIRSSIAIPMYQEKVYTWATNNPKGYREWFEEINRPFLAVVSEKQRRALFESNARVYASIEDIPDSHLRSAVQRVIQILKAHRNVHFSHLKDGDVLKPISAILSTIAAQVAQPMNPWTSVFDLLKAVLEDFHTYGHYRNPNMTEKVFTETYVGKSLIARRNREWILENPANPEDNLVDKWNENPDAAQAFFNWIDVAYKDLTMAFDLKDNEFRAKMDSAFGESTVSKVWGSKYRQSAPRIITSSNAMPKPWRMQ
ncbi:nucleotidyltransferase [Acutalibacter muris]|uniref:Cyclic GMP-AMP synthase n=1 Tax=Acutalibacter muris TaxID=1796620 RepID=A0A1Z2XUT7_9FIRM|nr:nucleotidyltransferase [Acutalibacter muris]ANU54569.1 nucleotidyltransferase [Hungateiclostridiaceae bacterium KB18]ASB42202.1 nucleotidyltransferase [Acutalibacter muris]QQR31477.1 nucleotidyltransferase [Acutalibacter muris]